MAYSIIQKTPTGIDMYDIDSNGGEVFGSHTIFGYEDVESLWNQTNATGGYNNKLNENSAIQMLNQVGSAAKQVFTPEADIPGAGGVLPKYTPAPVSPIQISPEQDIPVSGFGVPGGPQPGALPFNQTLPPQPKKVTPIVPEEVVVASPPEKDPEPKTWYEQIENIDQLKEAYISGSINEAQVTQWMGLYGISGEEQKTIWESWSKPEIDTSKKPATSVAGADIGTDDPKVAPITNEQGQQVFTASSYSSVPWNPMYKDYLDKSFGGGGNPMVYQNVAKQGLGNDPLQRTIYTQFLLQATEDDPWGGRVEGGLVVDGQPEGGKFYSGLKLSPDSNVFGDFLNSFKPLEGNTLQHTIKEVINTLRIPEGDWEGYQPGQEKTYSNEELRNFRWRNRFGEGPRSASNQQSLAALPIMQNTPATLWKETANLLRGLHDKWQTNPGRDPNEGWLEFVDRNNYFGMIQKPNIQAELPVS